MTRHDDLKAMLDNNKDSSKLEAMKRIIGVSMLKYELLNTKKTVVIIM